MHWGNHVWTAGRLATCVCALAALAVGIGTESAYAANATCTGTVSSKTLNSNVTVPPGASCTLENVTVNGNLLSTDAASVHVLSSTVTGTLVSTGGGGTYLVGSLGRPDVVLGNVVVHGGGPLVMELAKVKGNVQLQDEAATLAPNTLCSDTIGGNLLVQNNATQSIIGCDPGYSNQIAGNVAVLNNTVPGVPAAQVAHNAIAGNLLCENNSLPSVGGENKVGGLVKGECVGAGVIGECTGSTSCSTSATSGSGSTFVGLDTPPPSSGTERVQISFSGTPVGCTTPGTGEIVLYSISNPGSGEKEVFLESRGAAAEAAENAHPISGGDGDGDDDEGANGYVCLESPTPFETASKTEAAKGPNGFFGQLPECNSEDSTVSPPEPIPVPCVAKSEFESSEKSESGVAAYRTTALVPAADPRASH